MSNRTIVIFCNHGIGDVIMSLPAIKLLDSCSNGNRIILVLKSKLEENLINLFEWNSEISTKVVSSNKFPLNIFSLFSFLKFQKIEHLFFFHTSKKNILFYKIIVQFLKPKAVSGFFLIDSKNMILSQTDYYSSDEHKSECYIRLVRRSGLSCKNPSPLKLIKREGSEQYNIIINEIDLSKIILAFGPGSGILEKHKRWPIGNYLQLSRLLMREFGIDKLQIFLFGSSNEKDILEQITDGNKELSRNFTIICGLDLYDTLLLMKKCSLIICGDSGIAHIASVADIPIVLLCQPTNPAITSPVSNKMWVLRKGIKCSPCYREGFERGCTERDCMSLIEPREALETIKKVLNGNESPPIQKQKNKHSIHSDFSLEE